MKRCLIAVFLLCLGCSAEGAGHTQRDDIGRISVFSTPGKPMQLFDAAKPAEAIVVRHDGARYELRVGVNVPREGVVRYTETRVELTRQEWEKVTAVVERQGLLEFTPDEESGAVYDYGIRGFEIDGTRPNAQEWSKPLKNGTAPEALMRHVAQLARERIPTVHLYYFPLEEPK